MKHGARSCTLGSMESIVVAGAGVSGLEVALCLREQLRKRAAITLLAAEPDFAFRALSASAAFGMPRARRYELAPIARDLDARLLGDVLAGVEPHGVRLRSGGTLACDRLVIAVGAGAGPPADLATVAADVQTGAVSSVAFVVPPAVSWALPAYELALMSAAWGAPHGVRVSVARCEQRPLGLFGSSASDAVAVALDRAGVRFGAAPADREVALPELAGPAIPGLPDDGKGFVPVDPWGRVTGAHRIYAIGDAAAHPIKQGGLAAQQAAAVAGAIAHDAGLAGAPARPEPVLRGLLRTVEGPLYLRAVLSDVEGTSTASRDPLWWPPSKLAAPRLTSHLARVEQARARGIVLPSGGLALTA